jgi:putative hydrolase of the HAD superfamily
LEEVFWPEPGESIRKISSGGIRNLENVIDFDFSRALSAGAARLAKAAVSRYHLPDTPILMPTEANSNSGQTLLIDADDTLWENNVYFERAIAGFISFLNHHEYSAAQVREVLNQVERESILTHGYGLHSFAHSLVQTFERLAVEPLTPALHETINGFAHTIAGHPVELIDGVPETLQYLAQRHHLILMTKGAVAEQTGKVEGSGLKEYFAAVEIVSEKDASTYRSVVSKYSLLSDDTWMIGNSPKSDINPALAAGLNAVFVPHDQTWVLEHEEVSAADPPRQLLIVERFSELQAHF